MAVQLIQNKRITKIDTTYPNYRPPEETVEEISGNIKEVSDDDIYGDGIYRIPAENNGNLKLEEMMAQMLGKIDKFGNKIDDSGSQTGTEAVEVDIQREIAISKVDMNAVKSEVTKGKVKTNKDKLKALRRRNK
ncbi:MAG: hypothetical protein H8D94_01170 [Candidatus Pelagibacter sp.]|nr:hypothetical protein [Candidatus Pelagibacter sp.]